MYRQQEINKGGQLRCGSLPLDGAKVRPPPLASEAAIGYPRGPVPGQSNTHRKHVTHTHQAPALNSHKT